MSGIEDTNHHTTIYNPIQTCQPLVCREAIVERVQLLRAAQLRELILGGAGQTAIQQLNEIFPQTLPRMVHALRTGQPRVAKDELTSHNG